MSAKKLIKTYFVGAYAKPTNPILVINEQIDNKYFGWNFGTATTITGYLLKMHQAGGYLKNFKFEGSNNGTTWTTLDETHGKDNGTAVAGTAAWFETSYTYIKTFVKSTVLLY